jgi:hypothetical protein
MEPEDEKDPKRAHVVLSKGHEVVGPGYLRLTGAAAKVMSRGKNLGNSAGVNRVSKMEQHYPSRVNWVSKMKQHYPSRVNWVSKMEHHYPSRVCQVSRVSQNSSTNQ